MFSNSNFIRQELDGHRDLMYRIAYSWCHNPALADDLVQDAMIKALRNSRQLRDRAALKGWLCRILSNCWYDYLRRAKETVDLENLSFEDFSTGEDINEQQDIVRRVRSVIACLPMMQRQVITLVDITGFSYVEIAEILDIPIGTVMSRISRARAVLKEKLAEYDPRRDIESPGLRRIK